MNSDNATEQLTVTSATTWTVSKDGAAVELTLKDIQQFLTHLLLCDGIFVFDEATRSCRCSVDEMGLSLNGPSIQLTLFGNEKVKTV